MHSRKSMKFRTSALAGVISLALVCVFTVATFAARNRAPAYSAESAPSAAAPAQAPLNAAQVEAKVDSIMSRMTLEQKLELIGGVNGFDIRAFPSLGMTVPLVMADGPVGIRNGGPATTMPAGINLAATWDPAMAHDEGVQFGRDARAKGVNFQLGPGVNIQRAPMDGRNFEFFGGDPFLASQMAVGYIKGVQSEGVSDTVKHYVANNSEFSRHTTDDIVSQRALREIYLPAFEAAVKQAHVGAVMDAYNLVNGEHMTQDKFLNTEVLKDQWGFKGVLMSDWFATYDGVAAANSGMDLEMPAGEFMNPKTLLPAIHDGRVSMATINDKVRRILRLAIEFNWYSRPQRETTISRYNLEGDKVALRASEEGMVLLKNQGNLLPLDKHTIRSVAVIGPDAYPAVPVAGGSAGVRPFHAVSFLSGIAHELGTSVHTYYNRGIPPLNELAAETDFSTAETGGKPGLLAQYFSNENMQGTPMVSRTDPHIDFGAIPNPPLGYFAPRFPTGTASARWTGYYTAKTAGPYDVFAENTGEAGGYYRVYVDGKLVLNNWTEARALVGLTTLDLTAGPHKVVVEHHGLPGFLGARFRFGIVSQSDYVDPVAEKLARQADVVVLAVGFDPHSESEGSDRTFHLPPGQNQLIEKITSINPHTIVVITSGGGVNMTGWLDHIPALVEAWYPGQEGGIALAHLLFGDVDFSGRLPATFDRDWADSPVHNSYYPQPGTNRVEYSEGVFVGYRGYERSGKQPLFPFGFGLSYTTFRYSDLAVQQVAGPASSGPHFEASFNVTNTGMRSGADIAEVYVGELHPTVPRPARELKGFARVNLQPGQTLRVSVPLNGRSFAYWDTKANQWHVDPGQFKVYVGNSVDDVPTQQTITLSSAEAGQGDHGP